MGVIRHSRHLGKRGATSQQGPSCKNGSPVFLSWAIEGFSAGFVAVTLVAKREKKRMIENKEYKIDAYNISHGRMTDWK